MRDYKPESDLTGCLAQIFYNFSKNLEFKQKFYELLNLNNNDFTLRFLLHCLLERNIKSVFYTIASISYLLQSANYLLPTYADKLYK